MLGLTKPALLSFLPLVLAQASSYVWQVTNLQATDFPLDYSQTGYTPAGHYLSFDITDQSKQSTFFCSAYWQDSSIPNYQQSCYPIGGDTADETFQFAVQEYYFSAAGGYVVGVTEQVTEGGATTQYTGTIREGNGIDGGSCRYTPLQNKPDVTFTSCNWPAITVQASEA